MVVAGDLFGGAERQLLTLCRAGAGLFDSIVIPTLPGPLAGAARNAGITIDDLGTGHTGLVAQATALAHRLDAHGVDIVHTQGYRASVLAALASLGRPRRPAIRTVHGAPETSASWRLALNEWLGRKADRWNGAHVVYVSEELADRMGRPPGSTVIHNGVEDPPTDGDRPPEFDPGCIHLVAVGRLEPVKDLGMLIQAVAMSEYRSVTRLHLVGDGPLRSSLETMARNLGVQDNVRFHGFRTDALQWIGHADALVLSSRHEGIPYVLLEALALGTPVVATAVGGIPEVIRNDVDGLLVPPADAPALAAALARLHTDPALRARLSEGGRRRVVDEFSARRMAERYAAIYRTLRRPA